MNPFGRIAERYRDAPVFHLLYVGAEDAGARSLLQEARSLGCFRNWAIRPHASMEVGEDPLWADKLASCLVVIVDLRHVKSQAELTAHLAQFQSAPSTSSQMGTSSQMVCFGLVNDEDRLTFTNFIACVAAEIACVGNRAKCLSTLASWCSSAGADCPPIDLRVCFDVKQPSYWLRNFHHDLNPAFSDIETKLQEARLWEEAVRVIDVWQDALRNVLVFPRQKRPARAFPPKLNQEDVACRRDIFSRKFHLLVPGEMRAAFDEHLTEHEDFRAYGDAADLAGLLAETAAADVDRVIIRSADLAVPPEAAAPTILVQKTDLTLTWTQWQEMFRHNMLGSFRQDEFLRMVPDNSFPPRENFFPFLKKDAWRPFCRRPLLDAMNLLVDDLARIFNHLMPLFTKSNRGDALYNIFRCLAQAWHARGVYFGV